MNLLLICWQLYRGNYYFVVVDSQDWLRSDVIAVTRGRACQKTFDQYA
jgi:hypothetical protein